MPGHCLRTSFAANIATGDHGHAHAPTLSPSPSSSPVLAWGGGLSFFSQSISQPVIPSVTTAIYADDSDSATSSLPPIHLHPGEPRMDNATRTGTRVPADRAAGALSDPLCRCMSREKKELSSVQYHPVLYTSTVVTGWSVGGSSPVQHQKESSYGRNTGRHPLSDPAKKASPGTRETLSARTVAQQTRAACSNGTYMHLCTSTRLTKCIVSSRYQIAYRGHQSTSSRVKFANLSFSFPTAQHVSTPVRGSGHLSVSVAAVGFSTPTRLSSFLVPARSRRPPIAKKVRLGSTG